MAVLSKNKKVQRHGFYKVSPYLTIILLVIFIPLSIFIDTCFLSTKLNYGIPSFFNICVVESTSDFSGLDIEKGDVLLFKKQSKDFKIDQFVAYYEPKAEQPENGSQIKVGVIRTIGNFNEQTMYGIKNEGYYIPENAIIGVYATSSSFIGGIIEFYSSKVAIVLFSLLPLCVALIFLVLDLLETQNIIRTTKMIEQQLLSNQTVLQDNIEQPVQNNEISLKQNLENEHEYKQNLDQQDSVVEKQEDKPIDVKTEEKAEDKTPAKPPVKPVTEEKPAKPEDIIKQDNKKPEEVLNGKTEDKTPAKPPVKPVAEEKPAKLEKPVKAKLEAKTEDKTPAKPPIKPVTEDKPVKPEDIIKQDNKKPEEVLNGKTEDKTPAKPPVKPVAEEKPAKPEKPVKAKLEAKAEDKTPAKPPIKPVTDIKPAKPPIKPKKH